MSLSNNLKKADTAVEGSKKESLDFSIRPDKQKHNDRESKSQSSCRFFNSRCSRWLIKPNLCFWHEQQMSKWNTRPCGCALWKCLQGDNKAQSLRLEYEPQLVNDRIPFFDMDENIFYCCHQAKLQKVPFQRKCGLMFLCNLCTILHSPNPTQMVWIHEEAYKRAIDDRIQSNKKILRATITPYGLNYLIFHPFTGECMIINSCLAALSCISLFPTEMELFLFISRWFADCPPEARFWS